MILKIGRARARDIYADSVQAGLRAEVKCFAVFIAPRDVVRAFRADDCAEMFSFGGNDPESAGPGCIKIALHIDFQAIPGVFAGTLLTLYPQLQGPIDDLDRQVESTA